MHVVKQGDKFLHILDGGRTEMVEDANKATRFVRDVDAQECADVLNFDHPELMFEAHSLRPSHWEGRTA